MGKLRFKHYFALFLVANKMDSDYKLIFFISNQKLSKLGTLWKRSHVTTPFQKGYLAPRLNPNPGSLVAKMKSKKQNFYDKFIIRKKNWKKFVILHKCLVFNFVTACLFYKNDALLDYPIRIYTNFGIMCGCIQGGMQLILTGLILWGLNLNLNLYIFTTQTIYYQYILNQTPEISKQTTLFHKKSTHMCLFPTPPLLENRSWNELDAARRYPFLIAARGARFSRPSTRSPMS